MATRSNPMVRKPYNCVGDLPLVQSTVAICQGTVATLRNTVMMRGESYSDTQLKSIVSLKVGSVSLDYCSVAHQEGGGRGERESGSLAKPDRQLV